VVEFALIFDIDDRFLIHHSKTMTPFGGGQLRVRAGGPRYGVFASRAGVEIHIICQVGKHALQFACFFL